MSVMVTENEILQRFRERATAELMLALNEVKWWRRQIARGLVKPEHAEGYIRNEKRIIETKCHVLGFPKLPC
jgi:hypothetical protein